MNKLELLIAKASVQISGDATVRKVLAAYSPLKSHPIDEEAKAILEKHGLYLGRHKITHDEAFDFARNVANQCQGRDLASLFLASLSTGTYEWRGGLPSYAILMQMPTHSFGEAHPKNCKVCGGFQTQESDLTFRNRVRAGLGCLVGTNVHHLWFDIAMAHKTEPRQPNKSDIAMLTKVLNLIKGVPPSTKPIDLVKAMKDIFPYKCSTEQKRGFLDILGVLSVLETPKHKGFLHDYANLGLTPRKSRSSDWAYPMDWWTGADGVNEEAVNHWFGEWL